MEIGRAAFTHGDRYCSGTVGTRVATAIPHKDIKVQEPKAPQSVLVKTHETFQ